MTAVASRHSSLKPNGGRKHENMTLSEEKVLLARFAKVAGAGEMLNIHDLKAAYEGLEKNKRIASKESQKAQKSRKRIREP